MKNMEIPKVGVRIPPCANISTVADAVALAEYNGFDSAWLSDSQLIWRDTWMALAISAVRTKRITLGTAVTNVVTRHPSVIASAARTLLEIAPGRFKLGLGVGWSSAGMIGMPNSKHRELRQAVSDIRTLLEGGTVHFGTVNAQMTDTTGACPIYLGTQGPQNLRMAGELCDGVILTMTLPQGLLEEKLSHLYAGADAAGRSRSENEVVVWTPIHVTKDLARDLKRLKPMILISLRNQPINELAFAGINQRYQGPVPPGIETDGTHVADIEIAAQSCDSLVSDELALQWIRSFTVSGTPEEIHNQLKSLKRRGVGTVVLTPLGEDNSQSLPTDMIARVGELL